jgi:O-antigen ligase
MPINSSPASTSNKPRPWSTFEFFVIAFMALTPVVYRSFNLLGLLIILFSVIVALKYRDDLPKMSREMRWLCYLLSINLMLALFYVVIGRDSFGIAKDPLKLMGMIPIMLAIQILGMRLDRLYIGLALGMLGASIVVTYQIQVLSIDRGGEVYNPNVYSEVAMVSGTALLCSVIFLSGWKKAFAIAGAIAAFYCVLISQTRGTLVAIVPMGTVAIIALARFRHFDYILGSATQRKTLIGIAGVILIAGASLGYKYGGDMLDRYNLAVEELATYTEDRTTTSSVAIRLELWYGAWLSFKQAPLTGIGSDNRRKYLSDLESEGILHLNAYPWRHNHSDYFDSLQRQGLPGMLIVIGLYGILFMSYWRGLAGSSREQFGLALGGLLLVTGYASFSLTEVPLRNSLTLVFFIILNAILLGMLRRTPGEQE